MFGESASMELRGLGFNVFATAHARTVNARLGAISTEGLLTSLPKFRYLFCGPAWWSGEISGKHSLVE